MEERRSSFLRISIFAHVIAFTASLRDLYRFRRIYRDACDTIDNYSEETWTRVFEYEKPSNEILCRMIRSDGAMLLFGRVHPVIIRRNISPDELFVAAIISEKEQVFSYILDSRLPLYYDKGLFVAITLSRLDYVRALLTIGTTFRDGRQGVLQAIHNAIQNQSIDSLKLLFNAGAFTDQAVLKLGSTSTFSAADTRTILSFALQSGNPEVIKCLIEMGMPIDERYVTTAIRWTSYVALDYYLERLAEAKGDWIYTNMLRRAINACTIDEDRDTIAHIASLGKVSHLPLSYILQKDIEILRVLDDSGIRFGEQGLNAKVFKVIEEYPDWRYMPIEDVEALVLASRIPRPSE